MPACETALAASNQVIRCHMLNWMGWNVHNTYARRHMCTREKWRRGAPEVFFLKMLLIPSDFPAVALRVWVSDAEQCPPDSGAADGDGCRFASAVTAKRAHKWQPLGSVTYTA